MDFDDEDLAEFEREVEEKAQGREAAHKELAVILVDAQQAMQRVCGADLPDHESTDSWFKVALKEICLMLRLYITQATSDQQAIVFYGTREHKNSREASHAYIFSPLQEPSAQLVRDLGSLPGDKFEDRIGSMDEEAGSAALTNGLWVAGLLLAGYKGNAARVVRVFTQQADPASGLATRRDAILAKAQNLKEAGARLEPYPFVVPGQEDSFDQSFWRMLKHELQPVKAEPGVASETSGPPDGEADEDDALSLEVTTRFADLQLEVRRKGYKRRVLQRTSWHLAKGMELAVNLYALLHTATTPPPKWLHSKDLAPLKPVSTNICADTGEVLKEIRSWMFPKPSSANPPRIPPVEFTRKDQLALRHIKTQGLRLLGFVPLGQLLDYHQLRSSTFMYPDEATRPGSTTAFIALHEALRRRGRFALCSYVRNAQSGVVLTAVLPAIEALNEYTGAQEQPPGMHIITLPFADDLRHPEKDPSFVGTTQIFADDQDVAAARAMIEALYVPDFQVGGIPNPALQRHFQVLEAKALQEDPPELIDYSKPDTALMQSRAGAAIDALKITVYGPGIDDVQQAKPKAAAKRDVPLSEIQAMAQAGKLSSISMDQLKVYLKAHSLNLTGKKADLVARIDEHVAKKARA